MIQVIFLEIFYDFIPLYLTAAVVGALCGVAMALIVFVERPRPTLSPDVTVALVGGAAAAGAALGAWFSPIPEPILHAEFHPLRLFGGGLLLGVAMSWLLWSTHTREGVYGVQRAAWLALIVLSAGVGLYIGHLVMSSLVMQDLIGYQLVPLLAAILPIALIVAAVWWRGARRLPG
jgi:hypothetical protein